MWSNLKDDPEYWVNGCPQVFQNLTARCLGWQTVESLQEHLKSCWEAGSLHKCWVFLFAKAAWWEAEEKRTAGLYKPATQAITCSPQPSIHWPEMSFLIFSLSPFIHLFFSNSPFRQDAKQCAQTQLHLSANDTNTRGHAKSAGLRLQPRSWPPSLVAVFLQHWLPGDQFWLSCQSDKHDGETDGI